jgi:hypothetical protein
MKSALIVGTFEMAAGGDLDQVEGSRGCGMGRIEVGPNMSVGFGGCTSLLVKMCGIHVGSKRCVRGVLNCGGCFENVLLLS